MPYVLAVLAGIAAIVAYLWLCAFAVVHLSVPGMLIGAAAGVPLGLAVALFVAFRKLFGPQDDLVLRPADVAEGRFRLLRVPPAVTPDPAWPSYFAAQVVLDLRAVAALLARLVWAVLRGAGKAIRYGGWTGALFWPLLLPVVALLAGFVAGAAAGLLVIAVVSLAVSLLAGLVALVAATALRAVDRAASALRRSAGNCPRCYEVSRLPAYRCLHCSALHRDLRPGLLGVVHRRCRCGARLPTTVTRAGLSPLLAAVCPLCGAALHSGAGAATDVRVPVFGAPSSGKTHLVTAAVVGLLRGHGPVALADAHSKRAYAEFTAIVDGGGSAAKTDAARQPIAVTLRFGQGRRFWQGRQDALVHLYDAAGEALDDPRRNEAFQYLDAARTLVFVLDPFAVPEVRGQFASRFADLFTTANVSPGAPEPSYQATVTRLRRYSVPTARKRLAVVVSKRDLLQRLPGTAPLTGSAADIRGWLVAQGMDNLVTAAERDFGAVAYFFVSSLDPAAAAEPFRWLLAAEPVTLPTPQTAMRARS